MIPLEEKIYELMEKMYGQMQNGFKELRSEMQNGFRELRGDINRLEEGQVKLENELKEAKSALFDGYKQTYEKLEDLENKVDKLAATVESHDVKIEVIRGVK